MDEAGVLAAEAAAVIGVKPGVQQVVGRKQTPARTLRPGHAAASHLLDEDVAADVAHDALPPTTLTTRARAHSPGRPVGVEGVVQHALDEVVSSAYARVLHRN